MVSEQQFKEDIYYLVCIHIKKNNLTVDDSKFMCRQDLNKEFPYVDKWEYNISKPNKETLMNYTEQEVSDEKTEQSGEKMSETEKINKKIEYLYSQLDLDVDVGLGIKL